MSEREIDGVITNAEKIFPYFGSDVYIVMGTINGDRKGRFADGTTIFTSLIKESWNRDNVAMVKTLNSVYEVYYAG